MSAHMLTSKTCTRANKCAPGLAAAAQGTRHEYTHAHKRDNFTCARVNAPGRAAASPGSRRLCACSPNTPATPAGLWGACAPAPGTGSRCPPSPQSSPPHPPRSSHHSPAWVAAAAAVTDSKAVESTVLTEGALNGGLRYLR
eukprot:1158208-Pelagomonas_calceolata.AAC.35